ncbi:hypothetical protein GH741_00895 [Aquibacillus halophilus]|uniref:Capsule polysaccharide biosynthesis protein n=1 Tax=Aquibacillus halophilus TaxID=930132 RepID=A0A6A8D9K8_9BACI|nr:hypothetical protein [Aquibacillus halophilus]MRH41226.1 hypothetical protein [Aquibacillus halophilus]
MIKNKKVLLICKESFSIPLYFIAKKLLEEGNTVGAFFVYPIESFYKKSIYNENTFFKFKEDLTEVDLFGLEDLCEEYNGNYKKPNIDMEFLKKIEIEYTNFKSLNLQLTSSQLTTRQYHNRIYFDYSTDEQNKYWLELSYKKVINVLDEFAPDVILDSDDAELMRTILNEIAYKRSIPYITINYPRYKDYKIPTFCLGLKNEKFLIDEYSKCLELSQEKLSDEYKEVLNIREESTIMSKEFANTITSQYKQSNILAMMKTLLGKVLYFWNVYITNKNIKLRRKKSIIYPNPIKYLLFYLIVEMKKQILFRPNKYFETPKETDKYVYMPLHLIPESTTFVKAPYYIDELNVIAQVSKSLPIGWKLYVKEHQAMLGERSLKFYKRVKEFPNVKLVQLNYYTDPKPWIERSEGVITITGTSAYEASLMGKKSLIFGDVPFSLINTVHRIKSYNELPKLLKDLEDGNIDNIHSCAAYQRAIKNIGTKIRIPYLMDEGTKIISGKKELKKEYKEEIEKLFDFYNKAYEQYLKY